MDGVTLKGLGGRGYQNKITFDKMPTKHAHFGKKVIGLYLWGGPNNPEATKTPLGKKDIRVFFTRDGTKHPPTDVKYNGQFVVAGGGEPPNWLYYWLDEIKPTAGVLVPASGRYEVSHVLDTYLKYDANLVDKNGEKVAGLHKKGVSEDSINLSAMVPGFLGNCCGKDAFFSYCWVMAHENEHAKLWHFQYFSDEKPDPNVICLYGNGTPIDRDQDGYNDCWEEFGDHSPLVFSKDFEELRGFFAVRPPDDWQDRYSGYYRFNPVINKNNKKPLYWTLPKDQHVLTNGDFWEETNANKAAMEKCGSPHPDDRTDNLAEFRDWSKEGRCWDPTKGRAKCD